MVIRGFLLVGDSGWWGVSNEASARGEKEGSFSMWIYAQIEWGHKNKCLCCPQVLTIIYSYNWRAPFDGHEDEIHRPEVIFL